MREVCRIVRSPNQDGVTRDFQGTWIEALSEPVRDLLDMMLEEVAPFSCREANATFP
ncbi:MAG: hypothetical protein JWN63_2774, partial [Candidatus Acidoferrum typicum]|nr:hypothetical protein [Candidatus Acidoferrum typicum]